MPIAGGASVARSREAAGSYHSDGEAALGAFFSRTKCDQHGSLGVSCLHPLDDQKFVLEHGRSLSEEESMWMCESSGYGMLQRLNT